MSDSIFQSIFATNSDSVISLSSFLLCIAIALVIGLFFSASYSIKNKCTKSFLFMLALLPTAVTLIILMVNGNIGAGVAIAGAFSLIRFRSAPGSAKEIVVIFLAMGAGLVAGMGYLAYAVLFAVIACVCIIVFTLLTQNKKSRENRTRVLKMTVPEDLNYTEAFEEVFSKYTESCERISAKTTNMGSLYKLTYNIVLKDSQNEKQFIDTLRCRNGNLEISINLPEEDNLAL